MRTILLLLQLLHQFNCLSIPLSNNFIYFLNIYVEITSLNNPVLFIQHMVDYKHGHKVISVLLIVSCQG
jgi:hypothetical protein